MALRIPFAEWRPSQNHGYSDGGQRIPLTIKAIVAHSADSEPMADPPDRLLKPSSNPGSVHTWNRADGKLYQLVELDEPAWGNGVDYTKPSIFNPNGWSHPNTIIRNWYANRRNPNLDTFSMEFAGFGTSRGDRFSKPTDDQMYTWARVNEWLRSEGLITATRENVLLHGQFVRTACPDGRFTVDELVAALEESDVTQGELDDLILAIFGSTERDAQGNLAPKAQRLANAKARYQAAVATGRSVLEVAGEALSKAGKVPSGTKLTITGEVTTK